MMNFLPFESTMHLILAYKTKFLLCAALGLIILIFKFKDYRQSKFLKIALALGFILGGYLVFQMGIFMAAMSTDSPSTPMWVPCLVFGAIELIGGIISMLAWIPFTYSIYKAFQKGLTSEA